MKPKKLSAFLVFLSCAIILSTLLIVPISAQETDEPTANRYNVVFVVDASASMLTTDPHQYRYDAIQLFLHLMADNGNSVGCVTFGKGIVGTYPITAIQNGNAKQAVMDHLLAQPSDSYTDIGGALQTAVKMLNDDAKKEIPSIIILLTDGNTQLGSKEETAASLANKEDALEIARDKGYKIYSVCLNADGLAQPDELKQIAKATGGEFREISDAKDQQDVYNMFYQAIYDVQSTVLYHDKIPTDGCAVSDFEINDPGIEEANILVFGDITGIELIRPDGTPLSPLDMFSGKNYSLIKIKKPDLGLWRARLYGDKGATIRVERIFNTDLRIITTISDTGIYEPGQKISFKAKIVDEKLLDVDSAVYKSFSAKLIVKDYSGKLLDEITVTTADASGFTIPYTLPSNGTAYATVYVNGSAISTHSETFELSVGNTAPVPNEDVRFHVNRWPFLFKTNATFDLNGICEDAEGGEITYFVDSSTWLEDEYTLDGSLLTIENFSVSKGSFTIQAVDDGGASCLVNVRVTSTNIGLWVVILILAGGLIFLAVTGILTYRSLGLPFTGSFTVENLSTGDTATRQKNRGRLKVTSLNVEPTGLDHSSYFQATGKNYVYFISKKPVYSDSSIDKAKKIRIDSTMEVRISATEDFEQGIMVRFDSLLDNPDEY